MQIGDRIRMKRDFEVEPFFDEGWHLLKDMTGFVRYIDEESGELAVDFNSAFRNDGSQGDMVALKGDKEIGDKINKIIGKLAEATRRKKRVGSWVQLYSIPKT